MIVRPICPGTQTSDINLESVLYKTDTDIHLHTGYVHVFYVVTVFVPKGKKIN